MNRRYGQRGQGAGDILKSIVNTYFTEARYPGERHALTKTPAGQVVQANYIGPGTRLDIRLPQGDVGVNDLDNEAKKHDIAYMDARPLRGNKKAFQQAIWSADDKFINGARQSKDDPRMGNVASTMMSIKEKAEKVGILPMSTFSGGGQQVKDPAHRLRAFVQQRCSERCSMKEKGKKEGTTRSHKNASQKGGLIPLASILIPIVATLGSEAVSYLFKKLTNKQSGSGVFDVDDKREYIIDLINRHME